MALAMARERRANLLKPGEKSYKRSSIDCTDCQIMHEINIGRQQNIPSPLEFELHFGLHV